MMQNAFVRTLEVDNTVLRLRCHFLEKDVAKSIRDARWNPFAKCWEYPHQPDVIRDIAAKFPGIRLPAELAAGKKRPVSAAAADVRMPVKQKPFDHQKQAYAFAIGCLFGGDAL